MVNGTQKQLKKQRKKYRVLEAAQKASKSCGYTCISYGDGYGDAGYGDQSYGEGPIG